MNDKEKLDKIDRYLLGEISEVENDEMEKQLEDKDFKADYDDYKLLIEGVKYSGRKDMLRKLQAIEEESRRREEGRSSGRGINRYIAGIAASVALIAAIFMGYQQFGQDTPAQIAAQYFEPYPAVVGGATRSVEEDKTALERAMQLFESENYNESLVLLQTIETGEYREVREFYIAHAYHCMGNPAESLERYQALIESEGLFREQAEWYLALAYLQTGDKAEATKWLGKIKNSDSEYADKADKVLNSMNQ